MNGPACKVHISAHKPVASFAITMGGVEQLQVPSVHVGKRCNPWPTSRGLHQGLATAHSCRLGTSCGQSIP